MSTNTRPVKMVQLVMLDMWRVEGGPCISTLQLMRLSRLTCLGSTYFLVKINVWSVMLESEQELETQYPGAESTTDRLDISGTITGVTIWSSTEFTSIVHHRHVWTFPPSRGPTSSLWSLF